MIKLSRILNLKLSDLLESNLPLTLLCITKDLVEDQIILRYLPTNVMFRMFRTFLGSICNVGNFLHYLIPAHFRPCLLARFRSLTAMNEDLADDNKSVVVESGRVHVKQEVRWR